MKVFKKTVNEIIHQRLLAVAMKGIPNHLAQRIDTPSAAEAIAGQMPEIGGHTVSPQISFVGGATCSREIGSTNNLRSLIEPVCTERLASDRTGIQIGKRSLTPKKRVAARIKNQEVTRSRIGCNA